AARATDQPAAFGIDERRLIGSAGARAGDAAVELEAEADRAEQRKPELGEAELGRARTIRIIELVEQRDDGGPRRRLRVLGGRRTSQPTERAPGRGHRVEITREAEARGRKLALLQREELSATLQHAHAQRVHRLEAAAEASPALLRGPRERGDATEVAGEQLEDRKSTRLNSSHVKISYAVLCLKKKT